MAEELVVEPAGKSNRREAFGRITPPRVEKVLKALDTLSKCGNSVSYDHTEEERERIFTAIRVATQKCEESFEAGSGIDTEFSF